MSGALHMDSYRLTPKSTSIRAGGGNVQSQFFLGGEQFELLWMGMFHDMLYQINLIMSLANCDVAATTA